MSSRLMARGSRASWKPPFGPETEVRMPARVSAWSCLFRYAVGRLETAASRLAVTASPAAQLRFTQLCIAHSTPSFILITWILNVLNTGRQAGSGCASDCGGGECGAFEGEGAAAGVHAVEGEQSQGYPDQAEACPAHRCHLFVEDQQ